MSAQESTVEPGGDPYVSFHQDAIPGFLLPGDDSLEWKLEVFGRPGRKITVVIGAAAISGSDDLQYRHLCTLSDGGDVDIRVLPEGTLGVPAAVEDRRLMARLVRRSIPVREFAR